MGHAHPHPHPPVHGGHAHRLTRPSTLALRTAFFLNLGFTVVEAVGGWWTNSIAVLTDALHDAGDCLVLGLAWWLQGVARRGRDPNYSYGYGRYSMLGGWLASWVLIAGALYMLSASVPRLFQPQEPHAPGMMLIACFGLVMNGLAAWRLHDGNTLNERGIYLHLLEDVLGWAAILVGAVVIHFTGLVVMDPLMSIAISIYILWNAAGTLRQGTRLLMQAHPLHVDPRILRTRLMALPGVLDLHDEHTWSLDGNFVVHTVHIAVDDIDLPEALAVKQQARALMLAAGIHHATIELEWPQESSCTDKGPAHDASS